MISETQLAEHFENAPDESDDGINRWRTYKAENGADVRFYPDGKRVSIHGKYREIHGSDFKVYSYETVYNKLHGRMTQYSTVLPGVIRSIQLIDLLKVYAKGEPICRHDLEAELKNLLGYEPKIGKAAGGKLTVITLQDGRRHFGSAPYEILARIALYAGAYEKIMSANPVTAS